MEEVDYSRDEPPWVLDAAEKAEILVVMVGGCMSIIGALIHLRGSVTDLRRRKSTSMQQKRQRRKSTIHSGKSMPIMNIAQSTANLLLGLTFSFGSIPVPDYVEEIWFNSGTVRTCTAQGFFLQIGLILSTLSTLALTYMFYLVIVKNVPEGRLYGYHLPRLLGAVLLPSLIFSIIPFPLRAYNYFDPAICWIESYPPGCGFTNDYPCERGSAAIPYLGVCVCCFFFPVLLTHMVLFYRIYKAVRTVENQTKQYAGSQIASLARSREYVRRSSLGSVRDIESAVEASVRNLEFGKGVEVAASSSTKGVAADATHNDSRKTPSLTNRNKSKSVGIQALLICGFEIGRLLVGSAAFLCYASITNNKVFQWAEALMLTTLAWLSLQGFFSCALYVRPRNNQTLTTEARWFRKVVCLPRCCFKTSCCTYFRHHLTRRAAADQDGSSSSCDIESGTGPRNDFREDHATPQSSLFFSTPPSSYFFSWRRGEQQPALAVDPSLPEEEEEEIVFEAEPSDSNAEDVTSSTHESEPSAGCLEGGST